MTRALPLLLVAVVAALAPALARAADPGRWVAVNETRTPLEYYQGMTSDDAGHLYFDGFRVGGYRTDLELREQLRVDTLLPATLTAAEGYDHIGDWTFTGGRLIAPLECFDPQRPVANHCGRGAFGIVSPELGWLGHATLDPADIAKAMWAEASPDGTLIWTSAGDDLLAYDAAQVQPGAGPLRPARRLPGAVPPSGITGATFVGDRLFVAGQRERFQVWSIDLATGKRRLEIERAWKGESEGLDVVDALGGELHWQVMPFDPTGAAPTFGVGHGAIVSFVRRAQAVVRLEARPRRIPAGGRTRVRVTAALRYLDADHPLAGVRVRAAGARAVTDARGRATLELRPRRAGRVVLVGRRAPLARGRAVVRAVQRGGSAAGRGDPGR